MERLTFGNMLQTLCTFLRLQMEEKRGRQRFNKSVLPPLQQMHLFTQTESASLAEAQRAVEVGIMSSIS